MYIHVSPSRLVIQASRYNTLTCTRVVYFYFSGRYIFIYYLQDTRSVLIPLQKSLRQYALVNTDPLLHIHSALGEIASKFNQGKSPFCPVERANGQCESLNEVSSHPSSSSCSHRHERSVKTLSFADEPRIPTAPPKSSASNAMTQESGIRTV